MEHHYFIAIVDDDPDDLMFIQEALEDVINLFHVLPFQSSIGFTEFLSSATILPILVILDYNMPKMNAEDILIVVNYSQRLASIKTFILSTGMNSLLKERLMVLGACCCIVKPSSTQGYKSLAEDIVRLATSILEGTTIHL